MAVDHPHAAIGAAHQWHGLAAQVGAAFAGIFGPEITQPAAHFSQSHAELGGAQLGDGHLKQLPPRERGRQRLVRGKAQGHDVKAARIAPS